MSESPALPSLPLTNPFSISVPDLVLQTKTARNCISKYDITALKSCYEQEEPNALEGFEIIPDTFKQSIIETLRTYERVNVSKEDAPTARLNKTRAKQKKANDQDSTVDYGVNPTPSSRKRHVKEHETLSDAELEYIPN